MRTNQIPKSQNAKKQYVAGSSRGTRTSATLLLQMAREAEQKSAVAARIRELRGAVPQSVIADKLDITLRAYQEWEAGGGIKWENIVKLAKLHHVSEEYLLYGPENERPPATKLDALEQKVDALSAKLDDVLSALATTPADRAVLEFPAPGDEPELPPPTGPDSIDPDAAVEDTG